MIEKIFLIINSNYRWDLILPISAANAYIFTRWTIALSVENFDSEKVFWYRPE